MAHTKLVHARIDSQLKESAEKVLDQLGITPTSAIQMFYKQIVLENGIPFDLHLSSSRKEIDEKLSKGMNSIKEGKVYTQEEVNKILSKDL